MFRKVATRVSLTGILLLITSTTVTAATHTVMVGLGGNKFDPPNVVVAPGDTVEWVHVNGNHTVTSGAPCTPDGRFNDPLPVGGTLSYVIPANEPSGVIPYFCIPHCPLGMTATITVDATVVPAASWWGLIAMSLVLLAVGTVVVRHRSDSIAFSY